MTIHIQKKTEDPQSEIAISGAYNGTIWLSYAEQVDLAAWLLRERKDIVNMVMNRRK